MQSRYTNDSHVLEAFQEAERRLRAIAHIHERLYSSEDMSEIEFADYLANLAKELVQSHASDPDQIELELDLSQLTLRIERAIPLGLIANELIMNSIKHGLGRRKGRILAKLSVIRGCNGVDGDCVEFLIADSGSGLPEGLDPAKVKSMGLRLVSMLVRQLRGKMETRSIPEHAIAIVFPLSMENSPPRRPDDERESLDR
jgi:two-component sensor histidine kinase